VGTLSEELLSRYDEIAHRWYEAWRRTEHPHPEISEAALKNSLPAQLRLIGEQLRDISLAERPREMWKVADRLDPEKRVSEEIPIEEIVQEYRLVVETVRDWIEERGVEVPFLEYSYFYQTIFELTAESVRRYARRRARDRSEYLAGVMHQLRTPISTLWMTVEVLGRGGARADAATIAKLQRNLRRVRTLVEGVLRIERFQPGELPVRPAELYPARVVDEIIADSEHDAIRKKLRFEAHVDRAIRMMTDRDLLLDALGNLVQNAIKYTSAGFVLVEAEERQDEVLFRVRDSGPGIPESKRQTLFHEVQPGDAGGAGLGLRIAHHAALALGGEIGVESQPGVGSTFWLRLPHVVAPRDIGPADP
jgi:signal transduction histidine kinase